ncbi:MAG: hypothetical protein ACOYEC_01725 [Christensenellales bacterium]|jgi:hypothetical protein|nr:hypothetical protein [Clostridiales bacterium]
MAKRTKLEQPSRPARTMKPVYRVIDPNGTIPVAKPSSNIQLTPIVMPVSFVPYSTQSQPILTEEDYDYDY